MSDIVEVTPAKKAKATKAKKPKSAPSHPKVADMVLEAITNLKERGGSSLHAIKKYVGDNNKGVDLEKLSIFIRRYLKSAVANGALVQTKGKGANGSFKLSGGAEKSTSKSRTPAAKAVKAKKPKATPAKKKAAPKPKKAAAAKKPKKTPAKKPKTAAKKAVKKPKPVKLALAKPKKAAAKKSPKKAAAKKAKGKK